MRSGIKILIFLCLASYRLRTCAVVENSDDMWSFLLGLHTKFCGEIDMCYMPNNSHVEPSADLFPQPCCVPCSCAATCDSNLNCCPARMRFKSTYDAATTETHVRSDVATSPDLTPMTWDATTISSDTSRESVVKSKHSIIQNMVSNKHVRSFSDVWTNKTSDDNLKTTSVQTACIRPQLLYRLNAHPDSDAFEMMISCPREFKDTTIIEKCRAGQSNRNISDIIPMTSKLSGLTYVNKYCLFCNEHIQESTSVDEWQINIVWQRTGYSHITLVHPQFLMNFMSSHFCNVHFVPKNLTPLRKCKLYDVVSCNKTGLWETHDSTLESVCNSGEFLPVIHSVRDKRLLFKNIACVLCNIHSGLTSSSRLQCGYSYPMIKKDVTSRRLLSVNYDGFGELATPDNEDIAVNYIETEFLLGLSSENCPDDSVILLGRCRKTICPRDHYEEKKRCIPLYSTLTGLDINFKIKVTLQQNVKRKTVKEVAKKLKLSVISFLKNHVSLQIRDIHVYCLPNMDGKHTQPFLVDIFIYNASNKVKYNRAVLELHDFFYVTKSSNKLLISNDTALGVTYEIGHQSDYSDDLKTLHLLIGNRLKRNKPKNHLTISDVNWCVRTEFTANEIERLGLTVYRVLKTSIILYNDQYETDTFADPNRFYTCIDYFIDDADKVDGYPKSVTDESKSSVNIEDIAGKLPLPSVGTAVAVLAAILFSIVLFRLKYKHREQ